MFTEYACMYACITTASRPSSPTHRVCIQEVAVAFGCWAHGAERFLISLPLREERGFRANIVGVGFELSFLCILNLAIRPTIAVDSTAEVTVLFTPKNSSDRTCQ